jgi:hypothetical protein
MAAGSERKIKLTNNIVVDEDFISCNLVRLREA